MMHEQLNKLIPFINENCITYPLWEEGIYIPHLNVWKLCESVNDVIAFNDRIKKVKISGYIIDVELPENRSKIFQISIWPENHDDGSDGYIFTKPHWSIEEMIEIALLILK